MQNTGLVPSWLVLFGQTHVKCSVNVHVFLTSEQLDALSSSLSTSLHKFVQRRPVFIFSLPSTHRLFCSCPFKSPSLGNLLLSQPFSVGQHCLGVANYGQQCLVLISYGQQHLVLTCYGQQCLVLTSYGQQCLGLTSYGQQCLGLTNYAQQCLVLTSCGQQGLG